MNKNLLRKLPGVDVLLNDPKIKEMISEYGIELVTYAVRGAIGNAREKILKGKDQGNIMEVAKKNIKKITQPSLKPIINATGVILHTNIGRAPLGDKVVAEISEVLRGYSNLEFDLEKGKRGSRSAHLTELLRYLTGAEDALVVNNNAAAIILILNTLAKDREVIISRGELIEIGGSFRINEIMAAAGVKMVEVGTTNKTRLSDYEGAITDQTALIFKAHKSNYAIKGFTEEVSVENLANLAYKRRLPFVYDYGAGLMRVETGADLVCFSGDKLLGGPQAGIIVGKKKYISQLSKAQLMRALRVGKMTIAALSSVCRSYSRSSLFNRKPEETNLLAEKLQTLLSEEGIKSEIVSNKGYPGGGTLPEHEIASYVVRLNSVDAEKIYYGLLKLDLPILGILRKGEILFDLLTVLEKDLPCVAEAIKKVS